MYVVYTEIITNCDCEINTGRSPTNGKCSFSIYKSTINQCFLQSKHNYSLHSHLLLFVRQSTKLFQLINTHRYTNINQRFNNINLMSILLGNKWPVQNPVLVIHT